MAFRSPALTFTMGLTLALGLGANVAVFSVIDALLLEPPGLVRAPHTVVTLTAAQRASGAHRGFSYADLRYYREHASAFSELSVDDDNPIDLVANHDTHDATGDIVSGNYFALLGLTPSLGRFFSADEDSVPGRNPVVVLSYDLWQDRFSGDSDILQKPIALNGVTFTVIGIGPAGFSGLDAEGLAIQLWAPSMMGPGKRGYGCALLDPTCRTFGRLVGRLAPGVTVQAAQSQLAVLTQRLNAESTDRTDTDRVATVNAVRGVEPEQRGHTASLALLLIAAAAVVLVATCANIAGLLLARHRARRREIAMRRALGASAFRIVRQLVLETVPLAIAGCVGALLVAEVAGAVLTRFLAVDDEGRPATFALHLDPTVLVYTVALAFLAALLFGISPALDAVRPRLLPSIQNESPGAGSRRGSLAGALVVVQVALALVLADAAALMARSASNVYRGAGFDPRGVVLLRTRPDLLGYDFVRGEAYHREIIRRLEAQPGVTAVVPSRFPPVPGTLTGATWGGSRSVLIPGRDSIPVGWNEVGPGYLAMLRIPVIAGRDFESFDAGDTAHVAIVNQTLARLLDARGDVVGREVRLTEQTVRIVGVVRDAQYHSAAQGEPPFIYLDFWQHAPGTVARDTRLCVRVSGDDEAMLPILRRVILGYDSEVPISEDRPLTDWIGYRFEPLLMARSVFGYSGVLSVLLAAIGLYCLLLNTANRRRREIAIRIALGARSDQAAGLIVRHGMRLTVIGLAAGLIAALAGGHALGALLYGVRGTDVPIIGLTAALLAVIAYLASQLPARRASHVDPMAVLRSE